MKLPTRQNLHYQFCSGQHLLWHKQISAESTLPVLLRTESTLDEASNPAESALPVLQRTKSTLAQASPCRIYITCIVAGRIYSSDPLLLYSSAPLLLCSSAPLLLYSSTPLLLCSSTPLLLCSSSPLLLYSSTPLLLPPFFSKYYTGSAGS